MMPSMTLAARRPGPIADEEAIQWERVERFAELAPLAQAWNALVLRSGASVFQTFEWCAAWWEQFGNAPGRSLHVLIFRAANELCAVAPFMLETETLLSLPVRRHLSLLGSGTAFHRSSGLFLDDGPGDYLDIIAAPEHAGAVARLLARLLREEAGGIDALELLNIPAEGFALRSLRPALEAEGIACRTTDADLCPRLVLTGGITEYVRTLDASVRRRFQQAITAGEEGSLFQLRAAATEAEALDALGALIEIHQRRWRKLGYPGLFSDPRFTAFQTNVARAFFRKGWLRVTRADADGRCVAVRLSFLHDGRLYDYLSGFDDASPAAKRRPGLAILFAQIEGALGEGARVVDLLRGDEGYKFELTHDATRNANIVSALPREARPARTFARKVAHRRSFATFLLAREARLLRVQLGEHRFPLGLYHYARFRADRFLRKFVTADRRGGKGAA